LDCLDSDGKIADLRSRSFCCVKLVAWVV
jgi:hypothetical protein